MTAFDLRHVPLKAGDLLVLHVAPDRIVAAKGALYSLMSQTPPGVTFLIARPEEAVYALDPDSAAARVNLLTMALLQVDGLLNEQPVDVSRLHAIIGAALKKSDG